jgi:SAM-dependent methyltransferase
MNQSNCVVCGSKVSTILDLHVQPLANNLLSSQDEPFEAFPLGLAACTGCGHAQLSHFVDPQRLFNDYLYASGTSQTMAAYFKWFASSLASILPSGARVLEIASNDGSLMRRLNDSGLQSVGIDPAANLTAVATSKGLAVLTGYFPDTRPEGTFDAIVAMNVAAHTPDPLIFMKGIAAALSPSGIALVQTSQAWMISRGEFDTVYHEHYSFFSVNSMKQLADAAGLVLSKVDLVSVHGTSFLFSLHHPGQKPLALSPSGPFAVAWPDARPSSLASNFDISDAEQDFARFSTRVHGLLRDVSSRVAAYRAAGYGVALVGVAAKALTFVHAAKLDPDVYFDEASMKIGRYVPGARTAIAPLGDLRLLTRPFVLLLGAWNFADELIGKIEALNLPVQHQFLVYLPEVREQPSGGVGARGH